MTATYSGDPASSPKDAVRFYVQDTDVANAMLQDAEINFVLLTYTNVILAAAQCCRVLAAKFAQKVTKRVLDLSINFSDKAKQYLALAEELEIQGSLGGLVPYSGGTSYADKEAVCGNTDRPKPPFREKQFDERGGLGGVSTVDYATGEPDW